MSLHVYKQTAENWLPDCTAGFAHVMAHLEGGIHAHADRDGLTGVLRAVFIDRGGHAPGEVCPTAKPQDPHDYWCQYPDDECVCVIPPASSAEADR